MFVVEIFRRSKGGKREISSAGRKLRTQEDKGDRRAYCRFVEKNSTRREKAARNEGKRRAYKFKKKRKPGEAESPSSGSERSTAHHESRQTMETKNSTRAILNAREIGGTNSKKNSRNTALAKKLQRKRTGRCRKRGGGNAKHVTAHAGESKRQKRQAKKMEPLNETHTGTKLREIETSK